MPNHQSFDPFPFPLPSSRAILAMILRNRIASSMHSVVSIVPDGPSIIFEETSSEAMIG
jgi:hypothetical protein